MGFCTRAGTRAARAGALGVALALALSGCVTGHLLDAARRRERPVAVVAAWLEPDHLVLAWDADVRTDLGDRLGLARRAGAVPLGELGASAPVAADAVTVESRDLRVPSRAGRPVVLAGEAPVGCACDPGTAPVLEMRDLEGTPVVVLHEGARTWAALPLAALARSQDAAWVWPLVPVALAVDAVVVPPLVLFAPAVITMGD